MTILLHMGRPKQEVIQAHVTASINPKVEKAFLKWVKNEKVTKSFAIEKAIKMLIGYVDQEGLCDIKTNNIIMETEESFVVVFELLMPGAQKKTQHPITVMASDRVHALDKAEDEWRKHIMQYDVRVGKVPPVN